MLFVYGSMHGTESSLSCAASCNVGEQVVLDARIATALTGMNEDQVRGIEVAMRAVISEEIGRPELRDTRLERFFRAHRGLQSSL